MKKQTFLYVLLILLAISNGFFLVHYLGKPSRKGHKPESFIAKKLNFDENQMKDFKDMQHVCVFHVSH